MFGENLKYYRKFNHLTQRELAEKINVHKGTISLWESNNRTPDIYTCKRIADFLNISVALLFGESDRNNPLVIPNDRKETVKDLLSLSDRQFEKAQAYIAALVDSNEEMKNEIKKYID